MSYSTLTNKYLPTPQNSGRRTSPVTGVIIHHMAGNLTIEQCAACFQPPREASSNYGIGSDGRIGCYVDEENRAWTSSNWAADNRSITIEVADNIVGEPWSISDAAYKSLIALCADICKRYNITPNYDGTTNASFTEHRMYAPTGCPGTTIHSWLVNGKIIADIKAAMIGDQGKERTVWQYSANMTDAQKWTPKWNKDGSFVLVNKACGLALDVKGASTASGAVVQAYPVNGTKAQSWKLAQLKGKYNPAGAAPFEIIPLVNEKLRLDVKGASNKDKAAIQTYTANNSNAQRWVILDDGSGWWVIVNVATGKALDVKGGGK